MAAKGFVGKFGRARFLGRNLLASRWVVTMTAAPVDIANHTHGGRQQNRPSLVNIDIEVEAFYPRTSALDADGQFVAWPHANPPLLVPGSTVTDVNLYMDRLGTYVAVQPRFIFTSVRVYEVTSETAVKDAVRYRFRCQPDGAITLPEAAGIPSIQPPHGGMLAITL